MRWHEIESLMETSTAGGTCAGNVAVVPGNGKSSKGSIGAGFDPNGDFGVYPNPKKKKTEDESDLESAPIIHR